MKISLFNAGYVELVETYGSDERIIESARMSTNKGFQGWGASIHSERCPEFGYRPADKPTSTPCEYCGAKSGDEKLLRYLWEHKHHTPFEMAGAIFEIQAPIFVFREWHRHRTQSHNELSARYTELPNSFYEPSIDRLMHGRQAKVNKQSSEGGFTEREAEKILHEMKHSYLQSRGIYEDLIAGGVSRELARLVIPVAQYSRMRVSANLRNWLAFLTLRVDPAAQYEIRHYAVTVSEVLRGVFPRTLELFDEGRKA